MRNKIKQLMNKEEGFTLVELLAVIVILGIIVAIAIPSIGGVINNAQSGANEAEKDLIVEAGRMFFISEQPSGDEVGVDTLVASGYLEDRSDADTSLSGGVKRSKVDDVVTYEYNEDVDEDAGAANPG